MARRIAMTTESMTLDLVEQYRRDGYCSVPSLLSEATIAAALDELELTFRSQLAAIGIDDGEPLHGAMERLLSADLDRYLAAARHVNKLLSVQQLLFDGQIRKFLAALGLSALSVPTGPVVSIMSERLRIPGGYFGLAPHQDWASMQGSLDAVIVWTPLMDVTAAQFPLDVIPQSHRCGLWEGTISESNREIDPSQYADEDFVSLEVKRGDVVFMSAFTVHRTGLTHRGEPCRGLRIACNTRVENVLEPTFVERRFPCAYGRTVRRELMTPDFPRPSDMERIFGTSEPASALA
jgi:hypothetical protein